MRLGIDLDGVIANFNAGWMRRYNEEFGAELHPDLVTTWDGLFRLTHFGSMREFWHWARGGDGPSIFRDLDTFPGAVETLRALSMRHDIVIVTTKPGWAIHDTFAWIADKRIPTREIHVTSTKWKVACDVYLEDSPHQLATLLEHRPDAAVCRYVRPWNRPMPGVIDVAGWDEFAGLIGELAAA